MYYFFIKHFTLFGDLKNISSADSHGGLQFFLKYRKHGRHSARAIQIFHIVVSGGLKRRDMRHDFGYLVKQLKRKLYSGFIGYRRQMKNGIRGTAERHIRHYRVSESVRG